MSLSQSLPAIRAVLGAYRSTEAHITEEQITAAWAEYELARDELISAMALADAWGRDVEQLREALEVCRDTSDDAERSRAANEALGEQR